MIRSYSENNCDFPGQLLNHRMTFRPRGRVGQKQEDAVSRCPIEQMKLQILVKF